MSIAGLIRKVYFDETPLTEHDYAKSRKMFIYEGSTARTVFALTSGAYLAGFCKYLGASDQFNGIIAAMPVLSAVIQVFSPMVFEKLERRKFLISIFALMHRLLLGMMVFIPFIAQDPAARLILLAGLYLLSYSFNSFITPPIGNLIVSLTDESTRGRYFGMRDSYIFAFTTIVTLIMGRILDYFKQTGNVFSGFLVTFSLALLLGVCNFLFVSSVKEPPVRRKELALDIRSIIAVPLKDRKFRKIILMFFLWNLALQVGGPYFAVYMVTGLKLDYTYIMAMGLLSTITNIFVVRLWGRLADRKSWSYATKLSIGLLAIVHFLWTFVDANTGPYMIPVLHIMSGAAWAGINIAIFNIQFSYAPLEGRTIYLGFNAALGGLVGFLSTLLGSALLGILISFRVSIFTVVITNMQVVLGLSGILLGVCAAYVHLFVRKK